MERKLLCGVETRPINKSDFFITKAVFSEKDQSADDFACTVKSLQPCLTMAKLFGFLSFDISDAKLHSLIQKV